MGISNFLQRIKIKNIEQEGYNYYVKAAKSIEADSVNVGINRINNGELAQFNALLEETLKGMEVMEKLEQKFLRLKEKYKHDNQMLLNITVDWRDFNLLNYNLFSHRITDDKVEYKIRVEEMMKRFDDMLNK